jgi:GTP cyclohydrolase I
MNQKLIEQGIRLLVKGLDIGDDHNFDRTPQRVAKAYAEIFCPPETGYPVFNEDYTDEVILKGHKFYTLCPHHLLPVKLIANIGYIPNGKVIGASKLARLIHEVNRKPMTQEKLTAEILQAIKKLAGHKCSGAIVMLTGKHGCFRIRGIRSDAKMVTFKTAGKFRNGEMRERFFSLI